MFADDVCFLSFSLRRWGNPNPVWGLGFPLCSLLAWTRTSTYNPHSEHLHLHQGVAPHLLFFFLFVFSSFVGLLVGIVAGRLRSCSVFFWFVVVGCCSGSVCSLFALHARCVMQCRPGQKDETSFAPCRIAIYYGFLGILGEGPVTRRTPVLNWSTPPLLPLPGRIAVNSQPRQLKGVGDALARQLYCHTNSCY